MDGQKVSLFSHASQGRRKRIFSQISALKSVPLDKKSSCRTCAEACQMPKCYDYVEQILAFKRLMTNLKGVLAHLSSEL